MRRSHVHVPRQGVEVIFHHAAIASVPRSVDEPQTAMLVNFNIFGPRQDPTSQYAAVIPNFVAAALGGKKPTVFGDGEQTRDFCSRRRRRRSSAERSSTSRAPSASR